MDLTSLPTLPADRSWDVREFLNNEIQAYEPHSRVVLRVLREHHVLGVRFKLRDVDYPAYVLPTDSSDTYLRETADLMLERHARRMANLAATA